MAYAFDETFATGIPSGFGTVGGAGGVTATWNSTQQAVDAVFTAAQNFWKIAAAQQADDFWVEVDVEIVANGQTSTSPHFGFWFWDGVPTYEGHRLAVNQSNWEHLLWTAGGSYYDSLYCAAARPWTAVGAASVGIRRVVRVDIKRNADNIWWFRLSVDAVPQFEFVKYATWSTVLPCIFGYNCTLRLHRLAGATTSAWGTLPTLAAHRLDPLLARYNDPPPPANRGGYPVFRGLPLARGMWHSESVGTGVIAGTVAEKTTPTNRPLRRRVLCLEQTRWIAVGETWSDAVTGAYTFRNLNPKLPYVVIAFDHTGSYRAVIADNLLPEVVA